MISGEAIHALAGCVAALATYRAIDRALVAGALASWVRACIGMAIGAIGYAWEYLVQPIVARVIPWWTATPAESQAFATLLGACVGFMLWEVGKVVSRGVGQDR